MFDSPSVTRGLHLNHHHLPTHEELKWQEGFNMTSGFVITVCVCVCVCVCVNCCLGLSSFLASSPIVMSRTWTQMIILDIAEISSLHRRWLGQKAGSQILSLT